MHGFSAVDVDLPDLGCDFLAAGTHKWLFGPRGTGILWGRDWAPLTEVIPSFSDPSDPAGRLTAGRLPLLRAPVGGSPTRSGSCPRSAATGRSPAPSSRPRRLKEGLAGIPG